ncbi:MAG: PAS domain-containing protein [Paracoccaceae bacterium]
MSDVSLETLYDLWNEIRAGRIAPSRADIETSAFSALTEIMFQLEVQSDVVKIRNPGKILFKIAGSEPHGRPLVSLMSHDSRAQLVRAMKQVVERPAIAELVLHGQNSAGAELQANLLMMPLRSDFGMMDRMLCGITFVKPHAPSPLVLGITNVKLRSIPDTRVARQALHGFSEPAALFSGPGSAHVHQVSNNPSAHSGEPRGRFRVIKGGLDKKE